MPGRAGAGWRRTCPRPAHGLPAPRLAAGARSNGCCQDTRLARAVTRARLVTAWSGRELLDQPERVVPRPGIGLLGGRYRAGRARRAAGRPATPAGDRAADWPTPRPPRRPAGAGGPAARQRAGRAVPAAQPSTSPSAARPPAPGPVPHRASSSHAPSGESTWWPWPAAACSRAAYPATQSRTRVASAAVLTRPWSQLTRGQRLATGNAVAVPGRWQVSNRGRARTGRNGGARESASSREDVPA